MDLEQASRRFADDGWLATPPILDRALLRRVLETAVRIATTERDRTIPTTLEGFLAWSPPEVRPARCNQYIHLQYQSIFELVTSEALGRVAASLIGANVVRVFNSSLVIKPPGSHATYATVGWHADKAYWPTCTSERMLTAWIPLRPTTARGGTLRVIRGSHKWFGQGSLQDPDSWRDFMVDNDTKLRARIDEAGLTYDPTYVEIVPGEVSFHHMYTLHGSGVNATDEPRYAIAVHLQDGDNRYEEAVDTDGRKAQYVHDGFVATDERGFPDYADPEFCPVIWPENGIDRRA
jgi:ectoine hydroxylase-related dioxygenase (phytanoyl-CoA dioxygenase family)